MMKRFGFSEGIDNAARKHAEEALLKAGALQRAILNSANFSSIATDAKGVIQIFNVGAERMLGSFSTDSRCPRHVRFTPDSVNKDGVIGRRVCG